ncbi:hypothetical protein B0H13DRAFT_2072530 [Mycena leptocephala]|nr:hypothetical protein B0H13DRAFT_2072530 [Mycena leptocephala]
MTEQGDINGASSPTMKFLVAIAASLLLFSSATATSLDGVSAPVSPVVLEEGSLAARASGTFTLYTGKSFTGQSTTFAVNTGTCYGPLHEPFVSSLFSARSSGGLVCFMFKGTGGCNSACGVCVDSAGYHDMTRVPAVHFFRCEVPGQGADAEGCLVANCDFH